jgi:hypothetical protein
MIGLYWIELFCDYHEVSIEQTNGRPDRLFETVMVYGSYFRVAGWQDDPTQANYPADVEDWCSAH